MRTESSAGHTSAAVRTVLEAELRAARDRGAKQPSVVDVGGGSGSWAVPLASQGCLVTVVEPNLDALATLERRAAEVGVVDRITVVADDCDALGEHVRPASADLVLAHGLLEVVDDPQAVAAALAQATAPGGAVSVLVANRYGAVLHRALTGRLGEARRLLAEPDGVLTHDSETLLRRMDTDGLRRMLTGAGLDVVLIQGDGVVSDIVPGAAAEVSAQLGSVEHELAEFEAEAAAVPPLRDIAGRLHALARRPA
ncbi:methyltransferase family protein [Saccharomonospora marina XMU15]|uniref:Methyltransferase family protein n=1 Tax=Saccharomonospora marina XMU15 TaxID=882083 RepID=H5XAI7_9PSEU|nr:methyltransferase domain-containing protein [Saccharomonospora marina]EHR50417.1 methyltransferase family protein [Saccharomonospora marina XMU15]